MSSFKEIMNTASNRGVYNKSRKNYLGVYGFIKCSWCKYHRGCNRRFHRNDIRNWKNYRKQQWK